MEIYILSDGYFDIGLYQPIIATHAAPANLQIELKRLHLSADIYEAPINERLIRKNEQLILVYTGEGFYDKKNTEKLLYSLKSAGFSASDITNVLMMHAHRDHIGGILTEDENLVFQMQDSKFHGLNGIFGLNRDRIFPTTGDLSLDMRPF